MSGFATFYEILKALTKLNMNYAMVLFVICITQKLKTSFLFYPLWIRCLS